MALHSQGEKRFERQRAFIDREERITRFENAFAATALHHASRACKTGRRQLVETVKRGEISLLENLVTPKGVKHGIAPRRRS